MFSGESIIGVFTPPFRITSYNVCYTKLLRDRQGKKDATVAVLAGDGGTFDIGLQALSGAATRGENIFYVCNNNGAYMNTGIQTSTATPYGAVTTTNPSANIKDIWPKDLMGIIAAHNIPYAATASLAFMEDFRNKIKKAKEIQGFRLLMVDGPSYNFV